MTDQGELIDGRYRLVSRVGRGSMGVVWQARDERLDRVVAVKQLVIAETADESEAEEAVRRVMREARLTARLRHPHAITVYDVVSHDGKPCLVMEFLPSESLTRLVGRSGGLPPEQVANVGGQVAAALAAAHAEGIVHRDVTPGNVLITPDGNAKLADFGISRATGETSLTASGFVVGTPAYLAPEVAGGADAGHPSDVFSLGATLYFGVEGAPPFGTDPNSIALLHRIARDEITPPRRAGPLTDVLLLLLRRDPAERPAMPAVAEALAAVAGGRPVPDLARSSSATGATAQGDPRQGGSERGSDGADHGSEHGSEHGTPGTKVLPSSTSVLPPRGPQDALRRRTSRRLAVAGAAVALLAGGVLLGVIFSGGGQPAGVAGGPSPSSALAPAPAKTTAAAPPSTTSTSTAAAPSSTASSAPQAGCHAEYRVTNSWPGGYQVEVVVRNDGAARLTGWSVSWPLPAGDTISNLWNGTLVQSGPTATITNADFNAVLNAHTSTTFGLTATTRGNTAPTPVTPTCQQT